MYLLAFLAVGHNMMCTISALPRSLPPTLETLLLHNNELSSLTDLRCVRCFCSLCHQVPGVLIFPKIIPSGLFMSGQFPDLLPLLTRHRSCTAKDSLLALTSSVCVAPMPQVVFLWKGIHQNNSSSHAKLQRSLAF